LADEEPTAKSVLEIHEEFLQHVEAGSRKIKTLSAVTIFVSALLAVSYLVEIASPYVFGLTTASVNLRDPILVGFEAILTILALIWLYIGVSDFRFVARLSKSIRQARALEKEIEKEISG
jgi:hypothetical protein